MRLIAELVRELAVAFNEGHQQLHISHSKRKSLLQLCFMGVGCWFGGIFFLLLGH